MTHHQTRGSSAMTNTQRDMSRTLSSFLNVAAARAVPDYSHLLCTRVLGFAAAIFIFMSMLSLRFIVASITPIIAFAFLNTCTRISVFHSPALRESLQQQCLSTFTRHMTLQDDASSCRTVKVLALHGSEGTGPEFVERMKPLVEALSQRNVQLQLTSITAPFEKGTGFAWWTMPPGVRSFTATTFEGFETSALLVLDTMDQEGPFDLILGHSQGAILISALLALKRIESHPSIGYILNGVAMPNPYKQQLKTLKMDAQSPPRVLFVLGENDKMNPLEIGEKVKACMEQAGLDVSVCYHAGGHSVPVKDDNAVSTITMWITDGII